MYGTKLTAGKPYGNPWEIDLNRTFFADDQEDTMIFENIGDTVGIFCLGISIMIGLLAIYNWVLSPCGRNFLQFCCCCINAPNREQVYQQRTIQDMRTPPPAYDSLPNIPLPPPDAFYPIDIEEEEKAMMEEGDGRNPMPSIENLTAFLTRGEWVEQLVKNGESQNQNSQQNNLKDLFLLQEQRRHEMTQLESIMECDTETEIAEAAYYGRDSICNISNGDVACEAVSTGDPSNPPNNVYIKTAVGTVMYQAVPTVKPKPSMKTIVLNTREGSVMYKAIPTVDPKQPKLFRPNFATCEEV